MWSTQLFITELLGTLVLLFGVVGTTYTTKLKTFKLEGISKHLFTALGVGISLALAVYVGEIHGGKGWVNPAVALMSSIGNKTFDDFLPAITGEFLGGMIGAIIPFMLLKVISNVSFIEVEDKVNTKKLISAELLGSGLFLAGVSIAVFGPQFTATSGLIVGLSVLIAIMVFGFENSLLLNPAAGLAMGIITMIDNRKVSIKSFSSLSISTFANLSVAAIIGGTFYVVGLI